MWIYSTDSILRYLFSDLVTDGIEGAQDETKEDNDEQEESTPTTAGGEGASEGAGKFAFCSFSFFNILIVIQHVLFEKRASAYIFH